MAFMVKGEVWFVYILHSSRVLDGCDKHGIFYERGLPQLCGNIVSESLSYIFSGFDLFAFLRLT